MRKILALSSICLALAGCNKTQSQCSSETGIETVLQVIKDDIKKSSLQQLTPDGDPNASGAFSPEQIKQEIDKLTLTILDIRTSHSDPNSSGSDCAGTISVKIPAEIVNAANSARANIGKNTVRQLADTSGIKVEAGIFTADLSYKVQPTDNGQKVYGETEVGTPFANFLAEVVANALASTGIEQMHNEQQAQAAAAAAEQDASLQAKRAADLQMAQAENKLAVQQIGAIWKEIDPGTRQELLPLQRAWIAKTGASCRLEAASASIEPSEREAARLSCETRENRTRANELQQYLGGE